jgi:hypothetical protein
LLPEAPPDAVIPPLPDGLPPEAPPEAPEDAPDADAPPEPLDELAPDELPPDELFVLAQATAIALSAATSTADMAKRARRIGLLTRYGFSLF